MRLSEKDPTAHVSSSVLFPSPGDWFRGTVASQSEERGGPAFWVDFDDGDRLLVYTRKSKMKHVNQEDTDDEEDDSDSSDVPQLSVTGVDQCSICKDQFGEMEEDDKLIYELSRRHAFCADCIEEWSQSANSSNECPDCRRRFAGLRTCASATVGTIHREQRSKQQRAATSGSKSKYLRVLDGVRD